MLSTARARILFVTGVPGGRAVTRTPDSLDGFVTHYVCKHLLRGRFGKTRLYTRSYSNALYHLSNPGLLKQGAVGMADYLYTLLVPRLLRFSAR